MGSGDNFDKIYDSKHFKVAHIISRVLTGTPSTLCLRTTQTVKRPKRQMAFWRRTSLPPSGAFTIQGGLEMVLSQGPSRKQKVFCSRAKLCVCVFFVGGRKRETTKQAGRRWAIGGSQRAVFARCCEGKDGPPPAGRGLLHTGFRPLLKCLETPELGEGRAQSSPGPSLGRRGTLGTELDRTHRPAFWIPSD